MNDKKKVLEILASKLKALLEKEPTLAEQLDGWSDEAEKFRQEVSPIDNDYLPHFVSHYLTDADIRLKDQDYKQEQEKRIWKIIHALENGEIPDYWHA